MNFTATHPTLASFFLAVAIAVMLGVLFVYSMPPKF